MNRKQVYAEIEKTMGVVPEMFRSIPDDSLELEWELFKRVQLAEGPVPNKYKELIGIAVAAVTKCRYCAFFHTEIAKLHGATPAEIEDAVHYAKATAGWSAYVNGMQLDFEQFKREVRQACEHVRASMVKTGTMKG